MVINLVHKTSDTFVNNIKASGLNIQLNRDIISIDGSKTFLTAGTKITEKISEKLNHLKSKGIIESSSEEECIVIVEGNSTKDLLLTIKENVKIHPVLSKLQLTETLQIIENYVQTSNLPEKIIDHLAVFCKINQPQFEQTMLNLVFGTHIGRANKYSQKQMSELISVLFFADIGYARLDPSMRNADKVHPILSKEIVQLAGLSNPIVLAAILQHEEKLDGSGYPYGITEIHEYAQISQIVNQYSILIKKNGMSSSVIGELFLLGQKVNFRTGQAHPTIFDPKLQKPLIEIMQESLKTSDQQIKYAIHLHSELSKIINWTNTHVSLNKEIKAIQSKLRNSLWINNESYFPFKVKPEELSDLSICKGFVDDALRLFHLIIETANYLNRELHHPMELNGLPISGNEIFNMINPKQIH